MSDQFPQSSERPWEKLSRVAVPGAEYDSPERQPHPKCLKGTRVDLLEYIHGLLDNQEKSQIIWLHGTAGVGKSAVAFTVAEKMRALKVTEETKVETRLAGTFFFSRKHTQRSTTGHFFATLAYQLATNFPSVQKDVNRAIRKNPAVLNPDKSLHNQMKVLFLQPLRHLRLRLHECMPPVLVVDALDECTSEDEIAEIISLLGQALRDPDLPVIHILLTSRSEEYIRKAIQKEEMGSLVCEIPVNTSGEGVSATISLDGEDVDNDIHIFLLHSFRELRSRHLDFPQPTANELAQLASRAGRRFIVATTMMKFIDDKDNEPVDRLELMLELTSELLPGTEVYKLYDSILSTCANPKLAYLHLSIVAALADPLSMSQISKLLGLRKGSDVETALVQLRSFMDIPTDSSHPVNIYHSSIRDYVSDPSNCSLLKGQSQESIISPHSLLAESSFRLMVRDIQTCTALLDALSELKGPRQVIQSHDPQSLQQLLSFIVEPPEPLYVLTGLLWLRGVRGSGLRSWLDGLDGRAWLQTEEGKDWLQTQEGRDWLPTCGGDNWLQTQAGNAWLQAESGGGWLQSESGWLWAQRSRQLAGHSDEQKWVKTYTGLQSPSGLRWLQTTGGQEWLQTWKGQGWLQTESGQEWLQTCGGGEWLLTHGGGEWLRMTRGQEWLRTERGHEWLETQNGRKWLQTYGGKEWLQTGRGQDWLQTESGQMWLVLWTFGGSGLDQQPTQSWRDWLRTLYLRGSSRKEWLKTRSGQQWLGSKNGQQWLETKSGREWLNKTESGRQWLETKNGREWLNSESGRQWLKSDSGQQWLGTTGSGRQWLETKNGQEWLKTENGHDWPQTQSGQHWLQTQSGREWLHTPGGREWLRTPSGLQTTSGREWLKTRNGQEWLQTWQGREWLQTQSGRQWLQTPHGQAWQMTPAASVWVTMEEFSSTLEAVSEYTFVPELSLQPAFQAIQQFKSLPDFLIFPAFLALRPQDHSTSANPDSEDHLLPDIEIIHAMTAFAIFANEARERSRSASGALKYASQN